MRTSEGLFSLKKPPAVVGELVEEERPQLDADDWKEIGVPAFGVTVRRNQHPSLGH